MEYLEVIRCPSRDVQREGCAGQSVLESQINEVASVILEGLCTTRNSDGTTNVAPMGPIVDEQLTSFHFRPFQTSTTYANLKATGCGVFHVTDDVELIARAAVGQLHELPAMFPAKTVPGNVLAGACRWYEFEVTEIDDSRPRTEISTRIVQTGRIRDYFGLNRAKHAVLEAAILATRLHLTPKGDVMRQLETLRVPVEKTAGPREQAAFEFLIEYVRNWSATD